MRAFSDQFHSLITRDSFNSRTQKKKKKNGCEMKLTLAIFLIVIGKICIHNNSLFKLVKRTITNKDFAVKFTP